MAKYHFYRTLPTVALMVAAGTSYYLYTDIFSDIGSGFKSAGESIADVSKKAGQGVVDVNKKAGEGIVDISTQAGEQILWTGKQLNAAVMYALTGGKNKEAARWLRKEADNVKKFFEKKRTEINTLLADGKQQLIDNQKKVIDAIASVEKARLDIANGKVQIAKERLAEKNIEELATLEQDLLRALQSLETALGIIAQPACTGGGILCNFQQSLQTLYTLLQEQGNKVKVIFNRITSIINDVFVKEMRAAAKLLDP